jgi:Conjugative transposon protein TcpC
MRPLLSGLRGEPQATPSRPGWRARVDHESVRRMRLRARLPRYGALTAVALLAFAGARTAIFGAPPPRIERLYQASSIDIGLEGFAQDYARAYLSWSSRDTTARQEALIGFNPTLANEPGFQPSRGSEAVTATQVVQDETSALGGHIVTVQVTVTPHRRTEYLAVPVARNGSGEMTVSALPSFVGPPSVQAAPPTRSLHTVEDQELITVVQRALTNYLAGDSTDLTADLAPGTQVTYPPNQLQVTGSPTQVVWTSPEGVLVTVQAQDQQGASYTLSYEVGVVKTERWYVNSIEVIPSQ